MKFYEQGAVLWSPMVNNRSRFLFPFTFHSYSIILIFNRSFQNRPTQGYVQKLPGENRWHSVKSNSQGRSMIVRQSLAVIRSRTRSSETTEKEKERRYTPLFAGTTECRWRGSITNELRVATRRSCVISVGFRDIGVCNFDACKTFHHPNGSECGLSWWPKGPDIYTTDYSWLARS